MAYRIDFYDAARRHLQAGDVLNESPRRDVAGYLYGIAAECAMKEIMRKSGMRAQTERKDDPFYAHYPVLKTLSVLKTLLRDQAQGRRQGDLLTYANDGSFMQNWDIKIRYAQGGTIVLADVNRWHEQAKSIVSAMEQM